MIDLKWPESSERKRLSLCLATIRAFWCDSLIMNVAWFLIRWLNLKGQITETTGIISGEKDLQYLFFLAWLCWCWSFSHVFPTVILVQAQYRVSQQLARHRTGWVLPGQITRWSHPRANGQLGKCQLKIWERGQKYESKTPITSCIWHIWACVYRYFFLTLHFS